MFASKTLIAIPVVFLAAACAGGSGAAKKSQVAVSLKVNSAAAFTSDACGNQLSSARLVLRNIKLAGAETQSSGGQGSGSGGVDVGDDLEIGPALIDIAGSDFNGVIQQAIFAASVPDGTYTKAKFDIHKLDSGDPADAAAAATNPALADLMSAGVSVRIAGVASNGAAILFDSSLSASQEQAVHVVVGNSTTGVDGVTLAIDPSIWFKDGSSCLDPNDPANQSIIEDNIKASIKVDEDDNHDGVDDGSQGSSSGTGP